jgi:hypothetical protein
VRSSQTGRLRACECQSAADQVRADSPASLMRLDRLNGHFPFLRSVCDAHLPTRACDTPVNTLIGVKWLPNEWEKSFVNSEQKDFLNGARMPHTRLDVPGEGVRDETGFIDEKQLLARLPISRRTLGTWKARGIIPFIKIGRRCLYDWPNVKGALLRRQQGGQT